MNIRAGAPPTTRDFRFDPWLLGVFILTILICLPFLRMVYGMGDEGVLLNGAERMRHGELVYKDFFEFLPPGGFIITDWWLGIAGISVLSERIFGVLIIAAIASLTYLATRQTTQDRPHSAMITVLWVLTSQGLFTQLSHHWLTTLLSMIAFCAALASIGHSRRGQLLAFSAGATAAAAVLVTPTCGALAWLAAASFFVRQNSMERWGFLIASVILPALLLAYLMVHHDLAYAYADSIRFTAAHYASIQAVPFGFLAYPQTYPLLCLLPFAGFLTVIFCISEGRRCLTDRLLHLSIAFAIAGFIGIYPRPDIFHIGFEAPLVLPLVAYCVANIARHCQPILVTTIRSMLIILCVPSALNYAYIVHDALHTKRTDTPLGAISLFNKNGDAEMLGWVAALPSGAKVFFYPYLPYMSFLTRKEQVSKYDLFVPEYTLASQYQDACLSVMRDADYVVVDQTWANPAWVKTLFAAIKNSNPQETRGFAQALDRGFTLVANAPPFELRHRNATASIALCTGIAP